MITGKTYTHAIEIVAFDGDVVAKTLHARSEREAEKIDDGVNRQLDHERYFTRIRALPEPVKA